MSLNGLEIMSRVSELKAEQEQLRQSIHALKETLELNATNLTFLENDLKHYAAREQEDSTVLLENESESTSSQVNPLSQQLINWSKGINYEIDFWDRWFAEKGGEWSEDFKTRLRNDTIFSHAAVDKLDIDNPKILDVGAGPMTNLGKIYRNTPVDLTAVDPLAEIYSNIAKKYNVERPVVTKQGFAEDLTAIFRTNSFNVVCCTNALDHSFDPLRGLEEMLLVCCVGGVVILEHRANEAEIEGYSGFHQWNFDADEKGHFIIWKPGQRYDATKHFQRIASINAQRNGDWLRVTASKIATHDIDLLNRSRSRLQQVLSATVETLAFISHRHTEA